MPESRLSNLRCLALAPARDMSETICERVGFPPLPVCRLSVEQYEEMIRAGIVGEDDPIELLDGWLVPKVAKSPQHILSSELVRDALSPLVQESWWICSQQPVRLPTSMPEPDVMVVPGERRQYCDQIPRAKDVGLIVEVSDASLPRDRVFKKSLYAQAGIPCYWVVNLVDRCIEEYTELVGAADTADYRVRCDYSADAEVPLMLDGRRVAVIPVRNVLP
jgi:Uma2 family endonuclease